MCSHADRFAERAIFRMLSAYSFLCLREFGTKFPICCIVVTVYLECTFIIRIAQMKSCPSSSVFPSCPSYVISHHPLHVRDKKFPPCPTVRQGGKADYPSSPGCLSICSVMLNRLRPLSVCVYVRTIIRPDSDAAFAASACFLSNVVYFSPAWIV